MVHHDSNINKHFNFLMHSLVFSAILLDRLGELVIVGLAKLTHNIKVLLLTGSVL